MRTDLIALFLLLLANGLILAAIRSGEYEPEDEGRVKEGRKPR